MQGFQGRPLGTLDVLNQLGGHQLALGDGKEISGCLGQANRRRPTKQQITITKKRGEDIMRYSLALSLIGSQKSSTCIKTCIFSPPNNLFSFGGTFRTRCVSTSARCEKRPARPSTGGPAASSRSRPGGRKVSGRSMAEQVHPPWFFGSSDGWPKVGATFWIFFGSWRGRVGPFWRGDDFCFGKIPHEKVKTRNSGKHFPRVILFTDELSDELSGVGSETEAVHDATSATHSSGHENLI